MELGWGGLILLAAAGVLAWFWQDSLAARENANRAAIEACKGLGLQFLDGTVAFARLSLTRDAGWLKLRRTYVFDYTADSIDRRQGFVLLTGARVESVGYSTGETQPRWPPRPRAAAPQSDPGKVIELNDWRRRNGTAGGPQQPDDREDWGG